MDYDIRPVQKSEMDDIISLLKKEDLPISDIHEKSVQLFVCVNADKIIGVVGLENYAPTGLLRSLVVHTEYKGIGIGRILINHIISHCKINKISEIYLLTETAENYFLKNGFYTISRNELPAAIKRTKEFTDICPVSAVAMFKQLKLVL